MKDQISSAIPADKAELMADKPVDEKYEEQLSQRALDDLVWRMMDGQEYPRNAMHYWMQINRLDILCDCDRPTLAEAVIAHLVDERDSAGSSDTLKNAVERIVRDSLRDSLWHERRIAEMREEDKE